MAFDAQSAVAGLAFIDLLVKVMLVDIVGSGLMALQTEFVAFFV